ncbi:MAG TPA: hypothetical protein PLE74_04165 [Candidatus Cloacimonadota bacterium]|nr:hypothetical protein [Candidatus Cloacimonadota bacterium]HPT71454.1 hypothetical protein [Candidatus Cloacimonadota bacterium]
MSKKYLILVLLTFAAITANLFATESRMDAMGGMYGYTPDNTDIFLYPGAIYNYNKFVTCEMRNSSDNTWSIGANLPLQQGMILGVYFNQPTGIDIDPFFSNHSDYSYGDLDISKKLDVILGIKQGLAFGIGLAGSSFSPYKDLKESADYLDLKAGMSTDKYDMGVILTLPFGKVENSGTKEKLTFFDMGLNLNGRMYLIQKPGWTLYGLGNIGFNSNTGKYTPSQEDKSTNPKITQSTIDLNLGLGINYDVAKNTLLVLGVRPIGLELYSEKMTPGKYKFSSTDLIIPEYKVGLEAQVLPWLVLRAGATETYTMYSVKEDDSDGTEVENGSEYYSNFNSQVGMGMKFKNLTLDTVLNKQFLFDGPDAVGGTAPGFNSKLSLGYKF